MPRIAETAELRIEGNRRRLFIDGVEFPWFTSGISYARDVAEPCGFVTVRIPVEHYSEVDAAGATLPVGFTPPGRVPAGSLRRADVLGEEARQPTDFAVRLVDTAPEEQGEEGP